ncbi:hypothetical protein D3C76_734310 [compost metagenome]
MLRRQTIVDGDGDAAGVVGDVAADRVGAVQAADDEAAAEAPEERREKLIGVTRLEDSQGQRSAWTDDDLLGHRSDRDAPAERLRGEQPTLAEAVYGELVERYLRRQVDHAQEGPSFAVGLAGTQHLRESYILVRRLRAGSTRGRFLVLLILPDVFIVHFYVLVCELE